jgi:acetyl esterase/lipase
MILTRARAHLERWITRWRPRRAARASSRGALSCGLLALLCACPPSPRGYDHAELLWPGGAPESRGNRGHDRPKLFFYPARAPASDTAILVASGGSYGHHGGLRPEGTPTAQWLADQGITAIVLRYRVGEFGGYDHRAFFADGVRAVQTIRAR